jgi:hypothetical protein
MTNQFLNKEKLFVNTSKLAEVVFASNGYEEFHKNIVEQNIEFDKQKTYEIAGSNFFDFNQELYEDINHMNSISSGLYCEMSLITYRMFIWSSKGEGFEIFKHVLRGEEINNLKSEEDLKEYIYIHLNELEQGILKTYTKGIEESFKQFGMAIENRALPLQSILRSLSIENNIMDFRK